MLQLASGSNCNSCCIHCVSAHVAPPDVDAKSKLCSGRLSQDDALLLSKHKSRRLFGRCPKWLARLERGICLRWATVTTIIKQFPAHGELGTCRTSLVPPEQPVLCIPVRPTHSTVFTYNLANSRTKSSKLWQPLS